MADIDDILAIAESDEVAAPPIPSQQPVDDIDEILNASEEEEIEDVANEEQKQGVGKFLMKIGEAIDSYTSAPTRAALGKIVEGEPGQAIGAFVSQFGEDPSLAPTGKDIALETGLSDQPVEIQKASRLGLSPRDVMTAPQEVQKTAKELEPIGSPAESIGGLIDVGADVTNIIPIGATLKLGAKATGKGIKGASKAINFVMDSTKAGQEIAKSGTVIEATKGALNDSVKAIRAITKPTIAPDFDTYKELAKEVGIAEDLLPESLEFGGRSFISRASRSRAEVLLGEDRLKAFDEYLKQSEKAINKEILEVTGKEPLSQVEAGNFIKQAVEEGTDRFFKSIDLTRSDVINQVPGLKVTPEQFKKLNSALRGIERKAAGLAKRGVGDEAKAAKRMVQTVKKIRNSKDNFKQLHEQAQALGATAFKKQFPGATPVDIKNLRKAYFAITDSLDNSVGSLLGPEMQKRLLDNNAAIKEFLGESGTLDNILRNIEKDPEKIYSSFIKNPSTSKWSALKQVLSPDDFKQFQSNVLDSLVKTETVRDVDFLSGPKTVTAINRTDNFLPIAFPDGEADRFVKIATMAKDAGSPILGVTTTPQGNIFAKILENAKAAIENDALIESLKAKARKSKAEVELVKSLEKGNVAAVKRIAKDLVEKSPIAKAKKEGLKGLSKTKLAAKAAQVKSTQEQNKKGDLKTRRSKAFKK